MAMMVDQDQALGAYFLKPGRAELRHSGRTRTHFLATGGTTGGAFALIDETARCGETVPLHRHPADVESLYVIEGVLSVFLERSPCRMAAAGAFAHFAPGAVHGFRVESDTAHYLLFTTPRHGEFYRAISKAPGETDDPDVPIDDETIMTACRDYDVEFIGPFPSGPLS